MGKLSALDFEAELPHQTAELICLKCLHRYMGVWPVGTWLKELDCETCGPGYVVKTGQDLEDK